MPVRFWPSALKGGLAERSIARVSKTRGSNPYTGSNPVPSARMTKNTILLISGGIIFKDYRGRRKFLLVKQKNEEGWEIPKVAGRRGESSVRAVIRMTGEQAGMNATVLEEAGRFSGMVAVNGKSIPQKHLYYILVQKSGGEIMGFEKFEWLEFEKALKKITSKREKEMLRNTKSVLKEWEKTHQI